MDLRREQGSQCQCQTAALSDTLGGSDVGCLNLVFDLTRCLIMDGNQRRPPFCIHFVFLQGTDKLGAVDSIEGLALVLWTPAGRPLLEHLVLLCSLSDSEAAASQFPSALLYLLHTGIDPAWHNNTDLMCPAKAFPSGFSRPIGRRAVADDGALCGLGRKQSCGSFQACGRAAWASCKNAPG